MDNTSRSVQEVELEGYFAAALAFIDPQLTADASLDAIEVAATQRRQSFDSLPPQIAESDLTQLAEALEFVRRKYDSVPHDHAPANADTVVGQPAGGVEVHAAAASLNGGLTVFEVSDLENVEATGHSNGNGTHSSNGHAAEAVAAIAPVAGPGTLTPRRRSPLSRIWEDTERSEERAENLPETRALPLAGGLLLLAYEAWLAFFAGWVATRFMVWPRPGMGYETSLLYGHAVVVVGLATVAVAAWLISRYRTYTHHVAALFHAGAVLALLDLLRWRTEAGPDMFPRIDPPGLGLWEVLILSWIVSATAAHIVDLRAK